MRSQAQIKMANLLEWIFRRKELNALWKENEELIELNDKLIAGDCINLRSFERRMILDVLIHHCYLSKIHNPTTKYLIRQTWRVLKEKIKTYEALENQP